MDAILSGAITSDLPDILEIEENFTLLDDWDDRYRYVIELGRQLPGLDGSGKTEANKVQGCTSQVWLVLQVSGTAPDHRLHYAGDSDAHIVRGLVAILLAAVNGRSAREILASDPAELFERLGLREHLTPQRSAGFRAMVERIRRDAGQVS